MRQQRLARHAVDPEVFGAACSQTDEDRTNPVRKQIEEPQAESDVQIDQVGKSNHWKTEAENKIEGMIEQRDRRDQFWSRYLVVVGAQGGKTAHAKGQCKPRPHERISEKGGHDRRPGRRLS